MAQLTVQLLNESAVLREANKAAANSGGDSFPNDGKTLLLVQNTDASSHTATVTAQKTSQQVPGIGAMTKSNIAQAIAAGDEAIIGPFPPSMFNDVNGLVQITYSAATGMKVLPIRLQV